MSSLNPAMVGQNVTFTASVTGTNPTGTVAFKDGAATLAGCATVALAGSGNTRTATCTSNALSQATHTMTASYSGDPGNTSSVSPSVAQVVNAAGPGNAPILQAASSRKTHGSAGTWDLLLSLAATSPTIEPRTGPAHTLVFTFDKPITGANVAVSEGTAAAAAPAFSGNDVIVDLSGATNQQYVTVTLTNVTSSDGGSGGSATARVGLLLGDANQSRTVSVLDLALVNGQLAKPVSASNFLFDFNISGVLTVLDKVVVNGQLAKALPAP